MTSSTLEHFSFKCHFDIVYFLAHASGSVQAHRLTSNYKDSLPKTNHFCNKNYYPIDFTVVFQSSIWFPWYDSFIKMRLLEKKMIYTLYSPVLATVPIARWLSFYQYSKIGFIETIFGAKLKYLYRSIFFCTYLVFQQKRANKTQGAKSLIWWKNLCMRCKTQTN